MKNGTVKIVLLAVVMLMGCGKTTEKTINGTMQMSEKDTQETESVDGMTSSYEGYKFTVGKASIEVDAEFGKFEKQLGEKVNYYEAPSCAFGDLDKVHIYNGFEVDTYQTGGVDYVSAVVILDDTVSTDEGLCIGDSLDKAIELYGEATTKDDTQLIYQRGNMKLMILVKDNIVSAIEYLSGMLD